jgi:hypothetical protein
VIIIWMKSFRFRLANGSAALLVLVAPELLELEGLETDPTDMISVPSRLCQRAEDACEHAGRAGLLAIAICRTLNAGFCEYLKNVK